MSILGFIKRLLPHLEKNTILEDVRITKKELEDNVIPSYNEASNYFKSNKIKSDDVKDISGIFYRNYTANKSGNNLIVDIAGKLNNLLQNLEFVEKQIEDILEKDVIKEGLTAKKAVLIKAANECSFISRFSIDLLDYVYLKELGSKGKDISLDLTKNKETFVVSNLGDFARMFAVYSDSPKKFITIVEDIPDVQLNEKNYTAMVATFGDSKLNPTGFNPIRDFAGSPIYTVRLMIAEWQSNRYKAYRDKKRMLELRLLALQSYQNNNLDPKLEKEIEYLQNRIEAIEYKMTKMES